MRIVDARVIVCCPGRNFVTLKLVTEDGVYGLGDATLNGRELAVASYLTDHVLPLLIGRDARRIEDTWQYLYKGAYWRRGPVTMAAIAAVDTALWDIAGKTSNVPVYQLLGGASRDRVMVYAHANGKTLDEPSPRWRTTRSSATRRSARSAASPGWSTRTASPKATRRTSRPKRDGPWRRSWSTERYLAFVPSVFERLRKRVRRATAPAARRASPADADRGRRASDEALEPYRLFWMEDPVPAELQESFRLIRQHTTTPIAVGEVFNSIYDCQQLIEEQLIDYIRTTVTHAGGISHLRKIAALAELHHVRTGCHGATDLSPVCMAAALHFDLSVHNFGIQEHMPHAADTDRVFPHAYSYGAGYMHPGDAPGLGVDIDEVLAAHVPVRARLPAGQSEDRWDSSFMVTCQLPTPNFQLPRRAARTMGARPPQTRRLWRLSYGPLNPIPMGVGSWELTQSK